MKHCKPIVLDSIIILFAILLFFTFAIYFQDRHNGGIVYGGTEAVAKADEVQAPKNDKEQCESAKESDAPYVKLSSLEGVVMDTEDAEVKGVWSHSSTVGPYVGLDYLHQGDDPAVLGTVRYSPRLPEKGLYAVRISYSAFPNRATNTLVRIKAWDGGHTANVNQQLYPDVVGPWFELGEFIFDPQGSHVEITTEGADGFVIADAVQWVLVEKIED